MATAQPLEIRPQSGPQWNFCASRADVAIFGGAAGSGKSYGLLLDPTRNLHNPKFGGVILRRTYAEIEQEGGLLDESRQLYTALGGEYLAGQKKWEWQGGMRMRFQHLQHEQNVHNFQGGQIPWIGFDELTHFTEYQWWYLTSRNRSTSGVKGRVRGTCNPDPDSFVANLISWWIDQETGFPIQERSGVLRWYLRVSGQLEWADTENELVERFGDLLADQHGREDAVRPKSMTFIPATIYDNPILLEKDPDYLATLKALPPVEQARLLGGNWKVRASGGFFNPDEIKSYVPVETLPEGTPFCACDAAYTSGERSDWTGFVVGVITKDQKCFILDSWRKRLTPEDFMEEIFTAMEKWRQRGLVDLHLEAHPSTFHSIENEQRIRQQYFRVVPLKHGGRSKPVRIREIRAHLSRIYLREKLDDALRNDLIAYNPENEGSVPDDLADALAYLVSIMVYNPKFLIQQDPYPTDPIFREVFMKEKGIWDSADGEPGML